MKNNFQSSSSQAMSITETLEAKLNKDQKTFNRLVKKIEKLRKELEQTTNNLDKCLNYYSNEIHSREQELATLRIKIVKKVYALYSKSKMFSKSERNNLKDFISNQLSAIIPHIELDEEMRQIFKEAEGVSYEEARNQDFDSMKDEMKELFEEMGMDVNIDGMSADLSEQEMMLKMKEIMDNLKQQAEQREAQKNARKKTKKQLEKEEIERKKDELKNTNINKIYKNLAKAFHPDLEQEESKKIEKEDLMKQLTSAYESNDLHTLLRLEMEWIQKEEGNLEQLSDEKLRIYNEILKEQIAEIEKETFFLSQHPRYLPIQEYFPEYLSPIYWNELEMRKFVISLKNLIKGISRSLEDLQKDPLKEIRVILKEFKSGQKAEKMSEEELIQMFIQHVNSHK